MATKQECSERITRLQSKLQRQGLSGALLVYSIDIYYFTGTRQNSVLWVPAGGDAMLLVRKSLSRAQGEACIDDVRPFPRSKEFSSALGACGGKVGMTFDVMPVQQYNYYAKLLPGVEFVDISAINRELRSTKSPWEIERLRQAGDRLCEVFAQVPTFLRPGMREIEVSGEFEGRLRKMGGEGPVRMRGFNQELFGGLAVSGGSASQPGFLDGPVTGAGVSSAAPQGASEAAIKENEPILIDYTGIFEGYTVDMTRMFVIGALDAELQRAFDTALQIQELVRLDLRPGAICSELFARADALAKESGFGDHFMGVPGEQARFVGHGIGLELDEMPVLAQGFDMPLQAGQTIAIEPKFVFPGVGSVGIENTFVVGEEGGVKLTDMPDEITWV